MKRWILSGVWMALLALTTANCGINSETDRDASSTGDDADDSDADRLPDGAPIDRVRSDRGDPSDVENLDSEFLPDGARRDSGVNTDVEDLDSEYLPDGARRDARASDTGDGSGDDGSTTGDGGSPDGSIDPVDAGTSTVPGEVCRNGFDDNGNGMVDEGCACRAGQRQYCFPGAPGAAGVGVCNYGTQNCVAAAGEQIGAWGACTGYGSPTTETCDGIDNDCDRGVDEDCRCAAGSRSCYPGPASAIGRGVCRGGTQTCLPESMGSTWGACSDYVLPNIERCDGIDNDCDGMTDEGCNCAIGATRDCYTGAAGTVGQGLCRSGTQTCYENPDGTSDWGSCASQVVPGREICDGLDNNCNGSTDEDGCPCETPQSRSCYSGPTGTQGVGACRGGTSTCLGNGRWTSCVGLVAPQPETCNGIDDDCNGVVDDWCLCGPGQTVTYHRRDLAMRGNRSMIEPGDGMALQEQTCDVHRCAENQVAVELQNGMYRCVPPPPACPATRFPYYTLAGTWRCDRGCEIIITYGGLYDNLVVCAPRPDVTCGPGQTPHYAYEREEWVCRPTCDNGQYDIYMLGSRPICIPC